MNRCLAWPCSFQDENRRSANMFRHLDRGSFSLSLVTNEVHSIRIVSRTAMPVLVCSQSRRSNGERLTLADMCDVASNVGDKMSQSKEKVFVQLLFSSSLVCLCKLFELTLRSRMPFPFASLSLSLPLRSFLSFRSVWKPFEAFVYLRLV